jgi:hypothetical protein
MSKVYITRSKQERTLSTIRDSISYRCQVAEAFMEALYARRYFVVVAIAMTN